MHYATGGAECHNGFWRIAVSRQKARRVECKAQGAVSYLNLGPNVLGVILSWDSAECP